MVRQASRSGTGNGKIRAKFGLASDASPTLGAHVEGDEVTHRYTLADQGRRRWGCTTTPGEVRVRLGLAADGFPILRLLDARGRAAGAGRAWPTTGAR